MQPSHQYTMTTVVNVCGDQNRHLKPNHDVFRTLTIFVPKPNRTYAQHCDQKEIKPRKHKAATYRNAHFLLKHTLADFILAIWLQT